MTLDRALDTILHAIDGCDAIVLRDAIGLASAHTASQDSYSTIVQRLDLDGPIGPFLATPPVLLHDEDAPVWKMLKGLAPSAGPPVVERLMEGESWTDSGVDPAPTPPTVVAFYSFKGGVGRTTAAALTALKLAQRGQRVALVDFDIEAPGLHTLLDNPPEAGLVDFLVERRIDSGTPFDLERFAGRLDDAKVRAAGGELHVVPAGTMDERYLAKMGRVDLADVDAPPLEGLVQELHAALGVEVVILDARTGITDIGGVLLNRVSHVDVVVSGTGRQHMDGLRFVLRSLRQGFERRALDPDEIARRLLIVVSRVPWNRGLREDEALHAKIRADLYDVISDEIYRPLWPDGESPPAPDAADAPFESVLHDPVLIPHLADLPLQRTLQEIDYVQSNLSAPPFDLLVDRLVDTKLDYVGGATGTPPPPQNDVATTREELEGLNTDGAAENDLRTEADLRARFLPLPQFRFLYDPQAFLILGRKGSGKSALFQVLRHPSFVVDLADYLDVTPDRRQRAEGAEWLVGYDRHAYRALTPETVQSFVDRVEGDRAALIRFWKYLAAHVLATRGTVGVAARALPSPDDPNAFFDALGNDITAQDVNGFLLQAAQGGDPAYLVYDDLDRILPSGDAASRSQLISALIEWWQLETDPARSSSIAAKVFLRTDIFEIDVKIDDKSKIREGVRRHSIEWNDPLQLYRLLMRWVSPDLRKILRDNVGDHLYDLNTPVGNIPTSDADRVRDVVEWLVGEHMGASAKRGYSYTWITKHLADGKGKVLPRLLVSLFAIAARQAADRDPELEDSPTPPRDIRDALRTEVSEIAVQDLEAEYARDFQTARGGFIPSVFKLEYNTFPQPRDELVRFIRGQLSDGGGSKASEVIERLVEVGVFEERERSGVTVYQIPDIYLYGLGLSRRG